VHQQQIMQLWLLLSILIVLTQAFVPFVPHLRSSTAIANEHADEQLVDDSIDLTSSMQSYAPRWDTATTTDAPTEVAAKQRAVNSTFPLKTYPSLRMSDVYYNGTAVDSACKWSWNQNSEVVCIYVPLDTAAEKIEKADISYTCLSASVRLELRGCEVLQGQLYQNIDTADSVWYVDYENKVPYIHLELAKVSTFVNWPTLFKPT
jgi:CS domain